MLSGVAWSSYSFLHPQLIMALRFFYALPLRGRKPDAVAARYVDAPPNHLCARREPNSRLCSASSADGGANTALGDFPDRKLTSTLPTVRRRSYVALCLAAVRRGAALKRGHQHVCHCPGLALGDGPSSGQSHMDMSDMDMDGGGSMMEKMRGHATMGDALHTHPELANKPCPMSED